MVNTGRRRRVCIPVSERTPRSRPTRAALSSRAVAFARRRRERLAGPRAVVSARRKRLRSSSDRTSSRLRFAAIDSRASVVARSRSTRAPGSSVGGVIVVGDIPTSVTRLRASRYGEAGPRHRATARQARGTALRATARQARDTALRATAGRPFASALLRRSGQYTAQDVSPDSHNKDAWTEVDASRLRRVRASAAK